MAERVIPLVDERVASRPAAVPSSLQAPHGLLQDQWGRPLHDLRISVTDRCNFRCNYCMPKEVFDKNYQYLPHSSLLSFEEITRLARMFVAHGVRKLRLTGGEPLLRKNIEVLIEQLAALRTPDGQPLELTLTTNATLLARKAKALKAAGGAKLFPTWEPEDKINRWFLRTYKKRVGINDSRKVFHSFRHNLKTALARYGVNRDVSDLITGHKDQSVGGIYISDQALTMVQAMSEGINRVDYGIMGYLRNRIINQN